METLKLYRGEQLLAQVVLGERPLELGRSQCCDLVVDDPELSDRHFLALRRLGTVVAYDVSGGRRGKPRALPLGKRVPVGRDHALLREHETGAALGAGGALQRDTESLRSERGPRRELVLLVGRGADARRLRIADRPLHLGRGLDNDLVLSDRAASVRHCRLEPSGCDVLVRDLGSSNGTFVNEVRVDRALVGPGAEIRVGRTGLRLVAQEPRGAGDAWVAESPAMLALLADARRAASLPWPVLVLGESGSGKEGIAQLLHASGPRHGRPFVALNAGGVPAELIESELFGHERGAFTSANNARRGVFEQAEGGTLFLDEIGELPLSLQARLLRVLETGEVRRVGGESARKLDVRVVCATHRDLRRLVAEGGFRQDLYFRLARMVLRVPPLRARPEDLRALSRHFLLELEPLVGSRALSSEAEALLHAYPWPGNARELRNVLSAAAVAAASACIEAREVEHAIERIGGAALDRAQASTEGLRQVVEQHGGNLTAAARALGMARTTLRDRLKN
jgi:pSer/pThr/pTyr-binding forkhead associated (FHA) protein